MRNVSILAPSRNRNESLVRLLLSLDRQQLPPETKMDIVVIMDGCCASEDVMKAAETCRFPVRISEQPRVGISAAKNRAANLAQGEILLYINDDLFLTQNFVASHI